MSLQATSSQTAGPYFHIGAAPLYRHLIAPPDVPGERFSIRGRVLDGDGRGVNDALIEIWQADAQGSYAHAEELRPGAGEPRFRGFGRVATDDNGAFRFVTVKPGRVPGPGENPQAPHLLVAVFMRGLLKHLVTRLYFPDEAANAQDAVLGLVPAARRATLIAKRVGAGELEWNVVLQGSEETVFFDY